MRKVVLALGLAACAPGPPPASDGSVGGGASVRDAASAAATRGDPLAACPGIELTDGATLDFDVKAIHVSGSVRVDGIEAPVGPATGRVTFTNPTLGSVTRVAIGSDRTYTTLLAPGTYDIGYAPDEMTCGSAIASTAWPCSAHVLRWDVTVAADGVLDVDLPTLLVSGLVTSQALPFPGTGSLTFADGGTPAVAEISAGRYAIRLFAGAYDLGYAPRGGCSATPCNRGLLKTKVNVSPSLDVDVPHVALRGTVTLNAKPLPVAADRGTLSFASSTLSAAMVAIGSDGTYTVVLLPGSYDVSYSGVPSAAATSPLPRGPGVVRASAALTDATLDLDVVTSAVSGRVTVNGSLSPISAPADAVSFTSAGASSLATLRPDGTFATVLVAGSYDVGFAPASNVALPGSTYPLNAGSFGWRSFAKGSAVLDLDLPVVAITPRMTLDGAALPAPAALAFTRGGEVRVPISAAPFALLAGTYDVAYAPPTCASAPALPCNGAPLLQHVDLGKSGPVTRDLASALVQGRLTLGGAEAPASAHSRGSVSFIGKEAGTALTAPFRDAGPLVYTTRLLRGRYVVAYVPPAECVDDSSLHALPCASVVLAGCD